MDHQQQLAEVAIPSNNNVSITQARIPTVWAPKVMLWIDGGQKDGRLI
jgi:hypothetical protein